jgi:pyridoxamine 5'-phosphate oxidase
MNRDLGDERREYAWSKMEKSSLPDRPMELFSHWLEQALQSGNRDPTAMTLSTVDMNGQPSSRIVLLKKIEDDTLIFYTNYKSKKAKEIGENNRIAAHFFWPELERQVRITGTVIPVKAEDSDQYFKSRPYESKISAWASPQSEEIPGRSFLEEAFEKYCIKYGDPDNIPRPDYWGGYAIQPSYMEFWQGGRRRLHDRIAYIKKEEGWRSLRLAP